MYTLKLLAPILVGLCAEGLTTGQGDYCVIDNRPPNVVKYYEPGKSCYVNGTFYSKCEDRNGSSESVEASLREAEASLRNALAYAARQEKPFIGKHIADMIMQIDNLISTDALIDKIENRKDGDSGFFGTFFNSDG